MNPYKNKFEKLLKGIGIIELIFGILSFLAFATSMMKLSSGDYVLLVPTWQYVIPAVVLIGLQISLGILAILFVKSEKVIYCVYVGIALMICIALKTFVFHSAQNTSILTSITQIMFPALYTALALNIYSFYKATKVDK